MKTGTKLCNLADTVMKTQLKSPMWALSLLALLSTAYPASAYYDPGVQRWINRDPTEERSGANLYCYGSNDAVDKIDAFGNVPTPGSGLYGDCTKKQYQELNSAAGRACKGSGKMRCNESDDCGTIKNKMAKFDACIEARQALNDTCFGGQSSIENYEIANLQRGRRRCADLFCKKNCT